MLRRRAKEYDKEDFWVITLGDDKSEILAEENVAFKR